MTDFDVETITSTKDLAMFFEEAAVKSKNPKKAVNLILAELLAILNEEKLTINDVKITPSHIADLADALEDGKITSKQGKEVFAQMYETNQMPSQIIKEKGMEVVNDSGEIDKIVQDVIASNPKAVEDFKSGKTNVVGWLMGQVMKISHGKANPRSSTVSRARARPSSAKWPATRATANMASASGAIASSPSSIPAAG